mmetsp:Transcript_34668/g.31278  ORF Transcript_34668/g.31278 Transcript_34668/m.31278 type:complete len:94 (+) Transcript_34668:164-445(+)
MDFLECFLKETMRFYCPAPSGFGRVALKDHYLEDIFIKKGDLVRTEPMVNYFNPEYFENPLEFSPERWQKDHKYKQDPFIFIPFAAGPRNCIG